MISERSRVRLQWDLLIFFCIILTCLIIPFQYAFEEQISLFWIVIIAAIDVLFFVDIALNFRTTFRSQGTEVSNRKKIAGKYLRTSFAVDLFANFPLDMIFLLIVSDLQGAYLPVFLMLRLNRLVRVVRLHTILRRWESQDFLKTGYLRLGKLFVTVVLVIHWAACAWFSIESFEQFPENSWTTRAGIYDAAPGTQYVRSLYWTVTTMTTIGYGDITPGTPNEYGFTILIMVLGASMYAYIIGKIASLFSSLDSARISHVNRVESIMQFLHAQHVPKALHKRVRGYYEYLWEVHRGSKNDDALNDLPDSLKLELFHHMTSDLTQKVPLFKYSSGFLKDVLLSSLKAQTVPPESWIVREGEVGAGIFFIGSGEVEIFTQNGSISHGKLESGDYFGDISLLLDERRTASVKSLTYCDFFILRADAFNDIREEYPEFKEVLKKMSSEKTERLSTLIMDNVIL